MSKHKEMRLRLRLTISYKSLYFVQLSLELVPLFTGMRERSIARGGGDSHMKQTGVLIVSLRVFRAKRQYVKVPRSRLGFREETQNYAKKNRNQIVFLVVMFTALPL